MGLARSLIALAALLLSGAEPMEMPGAPAQGWFDPSIATDVGGQVYMAFSGVSPATPPLDRSVATGLARLEPDGVRWRNLGIISPASPFTAANGKPAVWQNEVSTLVFDPWSAPAERWRLIWHQYLDLAGQRRFEHGWLALKAAPRAEDLATAPTVKLFGAGLTAREDDRPEASSRPPVAGAPRIALNHLAPALSRCWLVSEPAALARPEGVYLAMTCFEPIALGLLGATPKVVLLRCDRPCRADTPGAWRYVGDFLQADDARSFGGRAFSAPDLFAIGDQVFLTVSPVGDRPFRDSYRGCVTFAVADLGRARLERDGNGRLNPHAHYDAGSETFNGACAFLPAGPQPGLVAGVLHTAPQISFTVVTTGISPLPSR